MTRSFRREEQAAFAREASLDPSPVSLFTRELLSYDEPRSEGYDEYFDPPLESKYECPICLLGLKEPVQTSCGHRFCRGCILRSIRDASPKCPVDNKRLNESQLYPDNFVKREILSHDVFCRLKKQHGCPWKGPLKKLEAHLSDCEFVELECPKECGRKLKRKDLKKHLDAECRNRTVPCQYCSEQVRGNSFEHLFHLSACPKYPQACEKCGQENIPRDMIDEHLEKECPNTAIKCPFHVVGCTYEGLLANVNKHIIEQLTGHLTDMSKKIVALSTSREAEPQTQRTAPRRTRDDLGARPQEQAAQEVYLSELSTQTHNHQGEIDELRHKVNNVDNNVHHLERRREEIRIRQERAIQELTMRFNRDRAKLLEYEGRVCNGSFIWRIENYRQCRQDAINGVTTAMHGRTRGDLGARPQEQAAQEVYLSDLFTQTQNQGGRDELRHGVNNNHNNVHHLEGQVEEILKSMDRRIQELTMRLNHMEHRLEEIKMTRKRSREFMSGEFSAQMHQLRGEQDEVMRRVTEESKENQTWKRKFVGAVTETFDRYSVVMPLEVLGRVCNGSYTWRIENFTQCRQDAVTGVATEMYSPAFYTSQGGYKLCVRINLNGVDSGAGKHIAVFVHMMQGYFDAILTWPFTATIILSILDQSDLNEPDDITETLVPEPSMKTFQRPTTSPSPTASGFPHFVPIEKICEGKYVKNNTMFFRAEVLRQ